MEESKICSQIAYAKGLNSFAILKRLIMKHIDPCESCKAIEFEKYFRKSKIPDETEFVNRKDFPFATHYSRFTMLEESSLRCGLCKLGLQTLWDDRRKNGYPEAVPNPDAVVYVSVAPVPEWNGFSHPILALEFSVDQLDCAIMEGIEGAEDYLVVQRLSSICGKLRIITSDGMLKWP